MGRAHQQLSAVRKRDNRIRVESAHIPAVAPKNARDHELVR
jgi:hypothetical protein